MQKPTSERRPQGASLLYCPLGSGVKNIRRSKGASKHILDALIEHHVSQFTCAANANRFIVAWIVWITRLILFP